MGNESYEIQGQTVTLPVVVRDASAGVAFFDVDAAAAQRFLPGDAFEVVESAPGTAQLLVALIDYQDNDLGDYLEVGLTLFVRPEGRRPRAATARSSCTCPSTRPSPTRPAARSGASRSPCRRSPPTTRDDSSTWTLTMDGQLVLRITVPRGGTDEMPDIEIQTYTLQGRRAPHDAVLPGRHAARRSCSAATACSSSSATTRSPRSSPRWACPKPRGDEHVDRAHARHLRPRRPLTARTRPRLCDRRERLLGGEVGPRGGRLASSAPMHARRGSGPCRGPRSTTRSQHAGGHLGPAGQSRVIAPPGWKPTAKPCVP